MFRWVFTPAVLAIARRTVTADLTVDPADPPREDLSHQDVLAVINTTTADEVCFEVKTSQNYWSLGQTSRDRLNTGDYDCAEVKTQDESTKCALTSLIVGDLVILSLTHFWVTNIAELGGVRRKISTLGRSVTVLKVGVEASRLVKTIQKITANYEGSTKSEGAHVLVGTGVKSNSFGEFACFKVKSEIGYMGIPTSDLNKVGGKLHKNEIFCIPIENTDMLQTIRNLAADELVTMVVASENVVYEWKNVDGTINSEMNWDLKFDIEKGIQNNQDMSNEEASVTFDYAVTYPTSNGNYGMQFCFKTVEQMGTDSQTVCFKNILQSVQTQTKLVSFTKGQQMKLVWRKGKIFFVDSRGHKSLAYIRENLISNIITQERDEQLLATQIVSAEYSGVMAPTRLATARGEANVGRYPCFTIIESKEYTETEEGEGLGGGAATIGSEMCFEVEYQKVNIREALARLTVGLTVDLRWVHVWVKTAKAWTPEIYLTYVGN